MRHFAQFYAPSTGYVAGSIPPRFDGPRELIPACGDRAVIAIDGRISEWKREHVAHAECKARGFAAYRLMCGDDIRDKRNNGPIRRV